MPVTRIKNNVITDNTIAPAKLAVTTAMKTFVGNATSANLASAVTGTTGSGNLVFATNPTFTGATITGNLTVDTNTLFVDATNNRVGIGTVTPIGSLDIFSGNLFVRNGNVSVDTIANYNNAGLLRLNYQGGTFSVTANSATIIHATQAGNVGIGTTTPNERLTVSGNISASGTVSGTNLVYNTGDQSISGVKNFSSTPTINGNAVATVVDPVRTTLTGNGVLSSFAISGAANLSNPSALIVAIDGALQEPTVDYSVSAGFITFIPALANGAKAVVISPTNTLQLGDARYGARVQFVMTADATITSATHANVAGATVDLEASSNYSFEGFIHIEALAALSRMQCRFAYTGTLQTVQGAINCPQTNGSTFPIVAGAFLTTSFADVSSLDRGLYIAGLIRTNAAGTLTMTATRVSGSGSPLIKAGTQIIFTKL